MSFVEELAALNPLDEQYAARFVDYLLRGAVAARASDVHIQPVPEGIELRWRLDGVLQLIGRFPQGKVSDVVARLKVLAGLLTYRTEVPQEGRIRLDRFSWQASRRPAGNAASPPGPSCEDPSQPWPEMRVSTFPTILGERAVVRFFPTENRWQRISQLGLPARVEQLLENALAATSGTIIVSGPAGSGKTTTVYACLSEIAARDGGGRSLVTLEDPVEIMLPGVSQSQVAPEAGFDFATGVRSLMRQDPDVILIGEIRDQATVEAAFGAALTGHLVLTTFHAGSSAEAVARLAEMGLEPYVLRSGLRAVLSQRLLRVLCECASETSDLLAEAPMPITKMRVPVGCPQCYHSGYRGRRVIAEWLDLDHSTVASLIRARCDAPTLAQEVRRLGGRSLWDEAWEAVRCGWTSPQEVRRVLGWLTGESGRELRPTSSANFSQTPGSSTDQIVQTTHPSGS